MTVDIAIPTETRESPRLPEVREALVTVSQIPYNNAAHIYEAAGIQPDIRMGGSCLRKLRELSDVLPTDISAEASFVTSQAGNTTHYAMVAPVDGTMYYLDPFLWQRDPMPLTENTQAVSRTLQDVWELRREPDEKSALFVVSLVQANVPKVLITHKFEQEIEHLPSPSTLPITSHLPSFMMQISDPNEQLFYKLWFPKEKGEIGDIWVTNGRTGERAKVAPDTPQPRLRERTLEDIERVIGYDEQAICDYFNEARAIELELATLIETTDANAAPAGHGIEE